MCEIEIKIANSYVSKAKSSIDRGIKFELTYSDYKKLYLTLKCAYSGKLLSHDLSWSIDRIDNNEGYTRRNCVICDREFNGRKSALTIPEVESIIRVWKKKKQLRS